MWPKLSNAKSQESLFRDARDFALCHGLVIRTARHENDNHVVHAPITLIPSPFPRRLYEFAKSIQPDINVLMYKTATDMKFITESLESVIEVDDFTKKIYDINYKVEREGRSQPVISCIGRSDYMLNVDHAYRGDRLNLRQVEVNAIASSLSGSSKRVSELHKYLVRKHKLLGPDVYEIEEMIESKFPLNNGYQLVCDALTRAYDLYDKQNTYILVVCEDICLNFSDQRITEERIFRRRPDIVMLRRRFVDLPKCVRLGPNRELLIDGNKEVAVVYFRYCYDPSNYDFPGAWDMRLLLERSRAIKCPSSNFHLSGVKKFQQVINDRASLERYLSPKAAQRVSKVFCRLWPLTFDDDGNKALDMALKNPNNLVLKPQREGGGHNIYKEAIRPMLNELKDSHLRAQ